MPLAMPVSPHYNAEGHVHQLSYCPDLRWPHMPYNNVNKWGLITLNYVCRGYQKVEETISSSFDETYAND